MQFIIAAILALVAYASAANTILFVNRLDTERTVYFTPNAGQPSISPLTLTGFAWVNQNIPEGWVGNFYSVTAGAENTGSGMLGEVNFNSWGGMTYFDVSAIVDSSDTDGVHYLFPITGAPASGCDTFPCDNVYVLPDDLQTKTTLDTALVCLLGQAAPAVLRRDTGRVHARAFKEVNLPRSFVEGH